MVVMAAADSKYCYLDVGGCGSSSDANIFKNTKLVTLLHKNELDVPKPRVLSSVAGELCLPFVLDVRSRVPYQSKC
jgi:hypothetical protein